MSKSKSRIVTKQYTVTIQWGVNTTSTAKIFILSQSKIVMPVKVLNEIWGELLEDTSSSLLTSDGVLQESALKR